MTPACVKLAKKKEVCYITSQLKLCNYIMRQQDTDLLELATIHLDPPPPPPSAQETKGLFREEVRSFQRFLRTRIRTHTVITYIFHETKQIIMPTPQCRLENILFA